MEAIPKVTAKDTAARLADQHLRQWRALRDEAEELAARERELSDGSKYTPQHKTKELARFRADAVARVKDATTALLAESAALLPRAADFTVAGMLKAATFKDRADESNYLLRVSRSSRADLQATLTDAVAARDLARVREAIREARFRAESGSEDDRRLLLEVERVERSLELAESTHAAAIFQRLGTERNYLAHTLESLETGAEDKTPRRRSAQAITDAARRYPVLMNPDGTVYLDPRDQTANNNQAA